MMIIQWGIKTNYNIKWANIQNSFASSFQTDNRMQNNLSLSPPKSCSWFCNKWRVNLEQTWCLLWYLKLRVTMTRSVRNHVILWRERCWSTKKPRVEYFKSITNICFSVFQLQQMAEIPKFFLESIFFSLIRWTHRLRHTMQHSFSNSLGLMTVWLGLNPSTLLATFFYMLPIFGFQISECFKWLVTQIQV